VTTGDTTAKEDLHGFVPDHAPVALLLIDVINDLDFPGNEEIIERVVPMARRIAALKARARELGIPAIYVNDNFGRWRSDRRALLEHSLSSDLPGRRMVELLRPDDDDYFVLKPKHSAFFSTTLDTLLAYLGARTLILTGVAGNICVFFTANDAYMRDFRLVVPADCVASNTTRENDYALEQMAQILKADTTASNDLDLERVLREAARSGPGPYEQVESEECAGTR
jgi:nicotinamidase-related amidase